MATQPKEKKTCPECGKEYAALGQHRRGQHGVYVRKAAAERNSGTLKFSSGLKVEEGFLILSDENGGVWLAEKIR